MPPVNVTVVWLVAFDIVKAVNAIPVAGVGGTMIFVFAVPANVNAALKDVTGCDAFEKASVAIIKSPFKAILCGLIFITDFFLKKFFF